MQPTIWPKLIPDGNHEAIYDNLYNILKLQIEKKGAPIKSTINNRKLTLLHFAVIMTCSYCLLRLVLAYNSQLNLNLLTISLTLILWSLTENFLWKVGNFHISKQNKSFSPMSSFLKFSFSCLNWERKTQLSESTMNLSNFSGKNGYYIFKVVL